MPLERQLFCPAEINCQLVGGSVRSSTRALTLIWEDDILFCWICRELCQHCVVRTFRWPFIPEKRFVFAMVLSLYCASNGWAMYIEPVSHLGNAANDLPPSGRVSSCDAVLWSTIVASHLCKCCIFYVDCSGWSSCNAPYRAAHPRYRDPNASGSSQTDLCGVLKSDTDSIGCFNLAFFSVEKKMFFVFFGCCQSSLSKLLVSQFVMWYSTMQRMKIFQTTWLAWWWYSS